MTTRTARKVYSTEVVAEDVILLGGQGAGGGRGADEFSQQPPVSMPRSAQGSRQPAAPQEDYGQGITDDDVPF